MNISALLVILAICNAWTLPISRTATRRVSMPTRIFSSEKNTDDADNESIDRTTFDQAGASLIEEEDKRRLEQMGDYDSNPEYRIDSIEKMREAIRERTANLGMEKSKVSAEYIKRKEAAANAAGSAMAASESNDSFGGLDLSQISSEAKQSTSEWNEQMPTMFYDPDDELSKEEQEQVDPIMKKNVIQQALYELKNAKWPDFGSAFREVILMALVVAFSAILIIGWDQVLRNVYTVAGFIPTSDDLANYASRFDELDLPSGWTNNMSESDVEKLKEMVPPIKNSLPQL